MKLRFQCLLTILFSFIVAGQIDAAEPAVLGYDQPVSLSGTMVREFDMWFVDSDLGIMHDPKAVARAVAEARRKQPPDPARLHEPLPHLILRLDQPISLRATPGSETEPAERHVSEIDLGDSALSLKEQDLGKTRFVVSGRLWHGTTVHHLRPVMMKATALKRAK